MLYYRGFTQRLGAVRPGGAVIIDAVDSTLVTTVQFGDPTFQDIPDFWYQRDYLPDCGRNDARHSVLCWSVCSLHRRPGPPTRTPIWSRIPTEAPPAGGAAATAAASKNVNYIGDALELSGTRNGLAVPLSATAPASWENWLFLDTRDEWTLGDDWRLNYSGRLNFRDLEQHSVPNA